MSPGRVEDLSQCQTFEAGESILEGAERCQDKKLKQNVLLALKSGGPDCIAAEVSL